MYIGTTSEILLGKVKTKEELNEVIEKAKKILKEIPEVTTSKNFVSKESRKAQLNFLEQLQQKLKSVDVFSPFKTVRQLSDGIILNNKIEGKIYG